MADLNGVIMQYFHWYVPNDGTLWDKTAFEAKNLAKAGFTAVWLPPAYKGFSGQNDVGYGVYDMYDLGEFETQHSDHKTIRTKYGTRTQYLNAIQTLHDAGLQVYADTVLNHRMGGDATETPKATPYYKDDRLFQADSLQEIKTYSHFYFPARQGKYSTFEWHWQHFDAVDYNAYRNENFVYLLEGKTFDDFVSLENGNFAFLMGCDLDFQNPEVRQEVQNWGQWYLNETQVDGLRLDAIKHISSHFFPRWLEKLRQDFAKDLFVVGEYWINDINALHWYLDAVEGRLSVFDVPLHYNFHEASKKYADYDMRRILDNTLMQQRSTHAVTFVENHDSQPLQALESTVHDWFKPLAYALILLRREGYPCVFYADYYGAQYTDKGQTREIASHQWLIDKFLAARRYHAYGTQIDYFDHPNTIGWTRLGDAEHPKAMAVLLSNGSDGYKWMNVGKPNTTFIDITEHIKQPVKTNQDGWGEFSCWGQSVSVWVEA